MIVRKKCDSKKRKKEKKKKIQNLEVEKWERQRWRLVLKLCPVMWATENINY